MCIYALFQYRNCKLNHPLGRGPRGGRAFRMRPCKLNTMANDEIKDSTKSKYGIYDHALPCEGEECRIYYVDQICHVCNLHGALVAGYPLNTDYGLTVAHVLNWDIPYNQIKCDFREISYTSPKKDMDEEGPVSPKGLFRETSYSGSKKDMAEDDPMSPRGGPPVVSKESDSLLESSAQRWEMGENTNPRAVSTESDDSTSSKNALRPPRLQVGTAQQQRHRTASSEQRVRVAAPEPFETHPGDTFFESY